MMPGIRIDIGCDMCGGKHEIYLQTNRIGNARFYEFDCPEKREHVAMPAGSFFALEGVSKVPELAVIATAVE
jgi:hypothetical protein